MKYSLQNQNEADTPSGYQLTPDEQLARKPRWQGETVDLLTALRNLALTHFPEEMHMDIIESSAWEDYFWDQATMITELITQLSKGTEDR